MTSIEIQNPSAFHTLRIYSQDRARNVINKIDAPAAPTPKRESRADLEKRGSEIVMTPTRVSTKFGSETRNVLTPFFKTMGFETLESFCTEIGERDLRASQQAAPAAPRGERVVDSWGALRPLKSVPPGGQTVLQLEEHSRVAVSCDESVMLQLSNVSSSRTIRLRNLDLASGEATHVTFIAPAREYPNAAIVSANGKSAAVIELMAT